MHWEDERYVRVYTRDTIAWLALGWEAQALFCAMLRKTDRVGVIECGGVEPSAGLHALTRIPIEVVRRALPILLRDGCVVQIERGFLFPNFIEAQEAKRSEKARQEDSRARRRDAVRAGIAIRSGGTSVYFLTSEDGPIKIGNTTDVPSRIAQLQTLSPTRLVLLAHAEGTVADEKIVLDMFADAKKRGDWFNRTPALMSFIDTVRHCSTIAEAVEVATKGFGVTDCDESRHDWGQKGSGVGALASSDQTSNLEPKRALVTDCDETRHEPRARASDGTARLGTEGSGRSGSDARGITPPRSEIDALGNPDAAKALAALRAHPALRAIATARVAEHAVSGLLGGNTTMADVLSGIRDLGMKAGGAEAASHAWTTAQLAESLGAFIDRARANREGGTRNVGPNGRAKPLPTAKQNVPDYLAQQAEIERREDEEEARLAAAGGKA